MPKKRRRAAGRKSKQVNVPDPPVISPDELRWRHNRMVRRVNVTATPLDAYRPARLITQRQFDAGDGLRNIWHRAGRAPRMTGGLDLVSHGHTEMTDAQAKAWDMQAGLMKSLSPLHQAVLSGVCCFEHGAELTVANLGQPAHMGLLILREGLEALAQPRRKKAA